MVFITVKREKFPRYLTKVHCLLSTTKSLSVHLPSIAIAQHEREWVQASGSTSEMKHIDYSKAKDRIFMIASLVVHSRLNVIAWNYEIDSFNQLNLHMSKWWVFSFCSLINVLQNIPVWIFGLFSMIIGQSWLRMHSTYFTIYKNKILKRVIWFRSSTLKMRGKEWWLLLKQHYWFLGVKLGRCLLFKMSFKLPSFHFVCLVFTFLKLLLYYFFNLWLGSRPRKNVNMLVDWFIFFFNKYSLRIYYV